MRWKNFDIPDQAILTYIENSARFRKKVARLIGTIYKKREKLTPAGRVTRAKKAAAARWNPPQDEADIVRKNKGKIG